MEKDKHIFKNQIKTVFGTIKTTFGMAFVALVIGLLAALLITKAEGDFNYLFHASWPYSIVIFVLLIALVYVKSVDYTISEQAVEFVRRDKVVQSFPFATSSFSSHITQTTDLNSGISSKARYLVVDDGNKTKKWPINLSKKNYDTFMSIITNYQARQDEPENKLHEG